MLESATFEFLEQVDRHQELSSLTDAFQGFVRKFGMNNYMLGDPRPPVGQPRERVWATTWPEEWLLRFGDRNYLSVDPVVRRVRINNQPLRWGPSLTAADRDEMRILEEAGEFGMKAGLAFPLYNRDGLSVIVSLGADRYEIGKKEERCLQMAATFLHAKLDRLRAQSAGPRRNTKLAPRERECLAWVAAGKTDWEISQILNIAEQTVHEYVQNALNKLNATTRAQAVAIAIYSKQIIA